MQKIRRKKEKQVSARLLILAAVLFILLCTGAVLLLNRPKPRPAARPEEPDLLLYQKDLSSLSSISLYRGETLQMTLLYQNSELTVEGRPDFPLQKNAALNLLSVAESLRADEQVLELPPDGTVSLSAFGLSPAERSARFRYTDGTEITLSVGSLIPIENPRYYAMVTGRDAIYSVTQDIRDSISRTLENIHPIEQPQVSSRFLDRITISGDTDFDAVRTAEGWQMQKPVAYPLSDAAMETLLQKLDSIRFAGWIGEYDQIDPAAYGLAPARRTMTLYFAETVVTAPDQDGSEHSFSLPANEMSISLGDVRSETSFYMLYEGQVYSGTVLSFGFLQNFSWEKYVPDRPVSLAVNHLSGVRCRWDGQEKDFRISYTERVLPNNDLETDEYGNILYDMTVSCGGETVSADAFAAWYLSLNAICGTQRTEPVMMSPDDEPVFSLLLVNQDQSVSRSVAICKGSAVQDILYVDGISLFTIDSGWRGRIGPFPQ